MTKQMLQHNIDDSLYSRIAEVIESSRQKVAQTANIEMVYCYYQVGRMIVEDEQKGRDRADYGEKTLQTLSAKLTEHYGKGFSYPNLRRFRQFYLAYSSQLPICSTVMSKSKQVSSHQNCSTVLSQLQEVSSKQPNGKLPIANSKTDKTTEENEITSRSLVGNRTSTSPEFLLSWTHYLQLLRIDDPLVRRFYEIEAVKENWSVRWLNRQICSSLYERVALSKDKDKVIELSRKGNSQERPQDILKEPYVLEFLGMKEESSYRETELEDRLITHLQEFLLELGTGFAFIGRQVRFSFEEQHFFVDLVFYNRLLRCFVLFDLKTGTLTHQDIGQMQMYVHYYDRCVKQEYENPTIGILLCKEKSEAIVKMTLPENENIYAAEYKLYLPDAKLLQQKLNEWLEEEKAHE